MVSFMTTPCRTGPNLTMQFMTTHLKQAVPVQVVQYQKMAVPSLTLLTCVSLYADVFGSKCVGFQNCTLSSLLFSVTAKVHTLAETIHEKIKTCVCERDDSDAK